MHVEWLVIRLLVEWPLEIRNAARLELCVCVYQITTNSNGRAAQWLSFLCDSFSLVCAHGMQIWSSQHFWFTHSQITITHLTICSHFCIRFRCSFGLWALSSFFQSIKTSSIIMISFFENQSLVGFVWTDSDINRFLMHWMVTTGSVFSLCFQKHIFSLESHNFNSIN